MSTSDWKKHQMYEKIKAILVDQKYDDKHHFERPFLTPYQISIEFEKRHPNEFKKIGRPIRGSNKGKEKGLSQYIARQLSQQIKKTNKTGKADIEGAFISQSFVDCLRYKHKSGLIESSLVYPHPLSMFRSINK